MGKAIRECQKMYNVVKYSLTLGRGKSKGEFGGGVGEKRCCVEGVWGMW